MRLLRNSQRRILTVAVTGATLLCAGGCANYSHVRNTQTGVEETTFRTFFVRGSASKISVATKDDSYSRTLRVGAVEGETESEKISALVEAAIKAGVSAAKP